MNPTKIIKDDFNAINCESENCGSPAWAFAKLCWIWESQKFEMRVVCGGCDHIQSKEYSEGLMDGTILEPIQGYDNWYYPEDKKEYQEVLHFTQHEKLIEIVGLPRILIQYGFGNQELGRTVVPPTRYP
ncbi:MAG: hypothetical protein K5790_10330 [Nitrosopumilus sp.]|uniref:hypothetical protein n=1 Tax=Nitrosopumilus sp. TaxID=2024843 RepID=UPI00247DF178|nr:hypothetical protein [Nitrosopumilus sp.]MCV0393666.1 hypothetical protein [Nitrosopumilus sp.]